MVGGDRLSFSHPGKGSEVPRVAGKTQALVGRKRKEQAKFTLALPRSQEKTRAMSGAGQYAVMRGERAEGKGQRSPPHIPRAEPTGGKPQPLPAVGQPQGQRPSPLSHLPQLLITCCHLAQLALVPSTFWDCGLAKAQLELALSAPRSPAAIFKR